MVFLKDIICPYCLQKIHSSRDLQIFCSLCGSEVVPTKLETALKKVPKCRNGKCNGYGTVRQCANCGSKLPSDILDYEKYLRFSLIGVSGSGKSNFLTTMLHEMRNLPNSPWILSPMDADTTTTYKINDARLYEKKVPVPATHAGEAPPPQFWKIKDRSRMNSRTIPSYSLTIFDGAGEDMQGEIDPAISRYIEGSKVLFILIDPLSLPNVAKTIAPNILNWSSTTEHSAEDSSSMVDSLATYIRNACGIAPNKLIDRDVAVVFTKIDAVRDSFGAATVMSSSPHTEQKGFVKADADAVDAEIRDWLLRQDEHAFLDAIDSNFRKGRVRYFGVSSFGQPPTGDQQLGKVIPHRVLDPLIWMLSKEGIVPTI